MRGTFKFGDLVRLILEIYGSNKYQLQLQPTNQYVFISTCSLELFFYLNCYGVWINRLRSHVEVFIITTHLFMNYHSSPIIPELSLLDFGTSQNGSPLVLDMACSKPISLNVVRALG